jgi:AcrR family transcriptional regulator
MARPANPNLRIELLAAAEAEFAVRGVDATKIEDICARARRSKGAFYAHFTSKEDVFRTIVEALLARLSALVATELVTDGKRVPSEAEFLYLWRLRDEAIFEFIWANRPLVKLILRGGYSIAFADLMDAFAQRTYDVILDSLNWGKEHRIYRRDFNTHLVAVMIAGAYDRLARELVDTDGSRPNIRMWVAEAQAFCMKGITDSSVVNS